MLPDAPLDPWGALNPYKIWLLVVLISALSLVGYAASRWLGEHRGLAITGFVGGLVSSTAVTLAFTRRSREADADAIGASLASGILLAWAVMFVRVGVIVAVLDRALAWQLAAPVTSLTLVSLALAWVFARRQRSADVASVNVALRNPFSLTSAIKFALLFTGVLLMVKLGERYMPASALFAVATVAGMTDVDAITLSMAGYAGDTGAVSTAATAIALAVMSNTLFKCVMVWVLGSRALLRYVAVATAVLIVTTVGALWLA